MEAKACRLVDAHGSLSTYKVSKMHPLQTKPQKSGCAKPQAYCKQAAEDSSSYNMTSLRIFAILRACVRSRDGRHKG